MIEINLKSGQQGLDLSNLGGLDVSKVNFKYVVISLLLLKTPDWFLVSALEESRNEANQEVAQLTQENVRFVREIDKMRDFEQKIKTLQEQERMLIEKLEVVKQIISAKRNPWNVLLYISKNIPNEVWLTKLSYIGDPSPGVIGIGGYAIEYNDQGKFQSNLENSVFFDNKIDYKKVALENIPAEYKAYTPFEMQARVKKLE